MKEKDPATNTDIKVIVLQGDNVIKVETIPVKEQVDGQGVAIPINVTATCEHHVVDEKEKEPGVIKTTVHSVGTTVNITRKAVQEKTRRGFGAIGSFFHNIAEGARQAANEHDQRVAEKKKEKEMKEQCLKKAEEILAEEKGKGPVC